MKSSLKPRCYVAGDFGQNWEKNCKDFTNARFNCTKKWCNLIRMHARRQFDFFFPGICQTSEDFYARMVFWMCLSAMLRFNRIWNFHISCEMFPMFKRICNPISNAAKFIESEWNWDYRAWFYQYSFNQYSISLLKDNLADTKHMGYKAGPVIRLFLKWQKNQVRGGNFFKVIQPAKKDP